MNFADIDNSLKKEYNEKVYHPLQSFEWGEFRKKTGVKVIRRAKVQTGKLTDPYQITIHKTPFLPYLIGYFPKGVIPSKDLLKELEETGKNTKLNYIQLEPDVRNSQWTMVDNLKKSFHPLFTKYTFILNLKRTEDELLKNMHQKTRYNIRVAEKHGVKVEIDNSEKAFEEYIRLTNETTARQKFYAHSERHHRLMWETLKAKEKYDPNSLQANLLKATYKGKTLVTYILFTFKDALYYPYGASSDEYRETMASTLTMWEAIKFGQKLGLNNFDMWGAANVPDPKNDNPYYGFHRFKQGFGGELVEFAGSFDLVLNPTIYKGLSIADKARWFYLRLRK